MNDGQRTPGLFWLVESLISTRMLELKWLYYANRFLDLLSWAKSSTVLPKHSESLCWTQRGGGDGSQTLFNNNFTFLSVWSLIRPESLGPIHTRCNGMYFWLQSNSIEMVKKKKKRLSRSSHYCYAKSTASCIFFCAANVQIHTNACKCTKMHPNAAKCT